MPNHTEAATKLKLTGLHKRIRGPQDALEPAPSGDAGGSGAPADDLELEKRWLRLVRVDTDQFRAFYDKYHDHLFRYLELKTGDAETAQDLTQDTFIYALEHLDRFTWQGRSFGAWLFHIARRRVLTRYWRSGRRRSEEAFLRRQSAAEDAADQASELARAQLLARVRTLMARFAGDRHDVFVLHVQMEYSLRDTALALGMPESTVRSHLLRGRLKLAEWLHNESALSEAERRALGALLARDQGMSSVPKLGKSPTGRQPEGDEHGAGYRRGRGDDDEA